MGWNAISSHIVLVLILYIIVSCYWINRFINERKIKTHVTSFDSRQKFARAAINFTDNGYIRGKQYNTTIGIERGIEKGIEKGIGGKRPGTDNDELTFRKLHRLLQSESGNSSINQTKFHPSLVTKTSIGDKSMLSEEAYFLPGRRAFLPIPSQSNTSVIPRHSNTCLALVSGDDALRQKTIHIIKEKTKITEPKYRTDDVMSRLFSKCKEIVQFLGPVGDAWNNRHQQTAFSVLLNRPVDQTLQFLRSVYHSANLYCLHVDLHATKKYFAIIKKIASCFPNIFLAGKRYDLAYPTVSRIDAHISCFKRLLHSSISWRYLVGLPGSVFPLRNVNVLSHFLSNREHVNLIASRKSNNPRFLRRVQYVHEFKRGIGSSRSYLRTKQRKDSPPGNFTLFRSENNFLLTRGFIDFVMNSREAKELLSWARDTRNPDEFFWATLDRLPGAPGGTPYRKDIEVEAERPLPSDKEDVHRVQENDLVTRLWKGTKGIKCGGVFHGNVCIFSYVDLRWLLTHDHLYAGPFDMGLDRIVIECLYQNLRKPLIEDYI